MSFISDKLEKTEEMIRFEQETGKKAIWRGKITKGFKKWKNGEKIYEKNKERLTILLPEDTKKNWNNYIEKKRIPTLSKLVRIAVKNYIEERPKIEFLQNFSEFSHDLKEPLTSIKGFAEIILENYSDKLDIDLSLKLKEIYDQSKYLENKINAALEEIEHPEKTTDYDILIVEDDFSTIKVLTNYFELKGYEVKGVKSGRKAIEELNENKPKLILLDIRLNDMSGFDVCKKIKETKRLHEIPVYYITAIPEAEVKEKLKDTGANGYFLKPFEFSKFNKLLH